MGSVASSLAGLASRALRCCGVGGPSPSYTPIGGGSAGRRRGNGVGPTSQARVRYVDAAHRFSFSYPTSWALTRSESAASAVILQAVCDNAEYAYMRFSISWEDVSWSALTAEAFGRALARQLSAASNGGVGGGVHVSAHGLYNQYARADGAYSLAYTVADPVDGAEMAVSDVIVVATHGGRRRAYTLSFACEVGTAGAAAVLAKQMLDSFAIEAPQALTRHRVEAAAAATAATGGGGGGGDDDGHVNVWERGGRGGGGAAGGAGGGATGTHSGVSSGGGSTGGSVVVYETPSTSGDIEWVSDTIEPARLAFRRPGAWSSAGVLSERAAGGLASSTSLGPAAAASGLRWWRAAWTCDRREASFKQLGVLCIDVTPLYDLMGGPPLSAAGGASAAALSTLLGYLAVRLRSEIAEEAAAGRGESPPPLAFPVSGPDAGLRPWADVFAQRWPSNCRLLAPPPPLTAAAIAASLTVAVPPVHLTAVAADQRRAAAAAGADGSRGGGAGTRLLKATGWLRTNGAVSAAAGGARGGGRGSGGGGGSSSSGGGGGGGGGSRGLSQHPWGGSSSSLESMGGGDRGGGGRSASPSPLGAAAGGGFGRRRRSSTASERQSERGGGGGSVYSSLGFDHDPAPAEGHAIAVTAALLLSLHEASAPLLLPAAAPGATRAPPPAGAAAAAGASAPRIFAAVVSFCATTDVWPRYEGLARHVFASLEVTC